MSTAIQHIEQAQQRKASPDIRPGDTVRVHQRIKEGDKERIQVFEGVVLARKHGTGPRGTITVRKVEKGGLGVERIFPIHSPVIEKFEVVKRAKVRRAKLYYLRHAKGKKARLKAQALGLAIEDLPEEEVSEDQEETENPAPESEDAEQEAQEPEDKKNAT